MDKQELADNMTLKPGQAFGVLDEIIDGAE